jgi:hypothetical protein
MIKTIDLIIEIAQSFAKMQKKNGSFPGGNNGPYNDPETPVRNTSHLIILFSKCYELTNNKKFLDILYKGAEYLYSKDARPFGYTFHHRNNKEKDRCNGLIGQAWAIEALVEASKRLDDEKYLLLAEEVFLQHPLNNDFCLWQVIDIDGKLCGIDRTFNHQLWFAACSAMIYAKKSIDQINILLKFIDSLTENMRTLENGLILHPIKPYAEIKRLEYLKQNPGIQKAIKFSIYTYLKFIKSKTKKKKKDYTEVVYKSIGYHLFNMYAFALLKLQIPHHKFWKFEVFHSAIEYMLSKDFKDNIDKNKYSYPYNPPGFEMPFVLKVLSDFSDEKIIEISKLWINRQIKRTYNKNTKMMDRNTLDPLTLSARIYELSRWPLNLLDKITFEVG